MLKNVSGLNIFMVNFWIVVLWHVAFFLACIKLPESRFDFQRSRFMPRDWEKGGRWYRDKLRIQEWKDKVPQFVSKDGFSKEHFTDMSLEYLDEFIMETCRAEWTHMNNCISVVVLLIVNPISVGLVVSFMVLLGNVPFAIIQRYNRFRLLVLRKKLLRDLRSAEMKAGTVTV